MKAPGERAPGISSHGRNVRLVEAARSSTGASHVERKGSDGDALYKPRRDQGTELPPYSEALAKQVTRTRELQAKEAERRVGKTLKDLGLGIGQVNIEQPTTGGKIEPDEKDGIPH